MRKSLLPRHWIRRTPHGSSSGGTPAWSAKHQASLSCFSTVQRLGTHLGVPEGTNEDNIPQPTHLVRSIRPIVSLDVNYCTKGGDRISGQAGTASSPWTELYRGQGEKFDVEGLGPCRRYFFRARLSASVAARTRVIWR